MRQIRRISAVFVCWVAVSAAVSAQETFGSQPFGRLGFGTLTVAPDVSAYEHFRDSVTFAMRMRDSLWLRPAVRSWRMNRQIQPVTMTAGAMPTIVPAGAGQPFLHNPFSADYRNEGLLTAWQGGALFGSGSHTSMPGLMSVQDATIGVTHTAGNLTMTAAVSADRANLWRSGTAGAAGGGGLSTLTNTTYFTVGGQLTYSFSDNLSATVFGRYSTNRSYFSMAAMPYLGTSGYGGYLTYMGSTLGIDVGVERYYDTFARRWVTSPIVTPKIRFSDEFTLNLPVGPLVKDMLHNVLHKDKRREGPMIMPEPVPTVGDIPFMPPEMPR